MSSNPGYRDTRREFAPRGGYTRGRGGGGRGGGGFNKPRRYWDNDDFVDKDKEHGGRRRYSRSRSRSHSRSYSRSRSRSASPPPRRRSDGRSDEGTNRRADQDLYEPYAPQLPPPKQQDSIHSVNNWKPTTEFSMPVVGEYVPHQANGGSTNTYDGQNQSAEAIQQLQQRMQMQKFQLQQQSIDDPSITFSGYGFPAPVKSAEALGSQLYSQGLNLGKNQENDPSPDTSHSSKKKKEKRKKKKSRRRSSSSSSSSSDDSSGSRRRRKSKKGRDSDDSSESSESEEKKQKEKESSSSGTGGLTDEQKDALLKQKETYKKKLEILEREILKLQSKEDDLKRTRADIRLIDENLKLQAELKGRCKAVHIVLEKINDVLQVDKSAVKGHPVPPPPPIISHQAIRPQEKLERKDSSSFLDVDFIDNGQHWCRLCNVFPETVEKMLDHFHSEAHHNQVEQLGIDDKPWHKRNAVPEKPPSVSAKKSSFKGMQFFSPVEGWYCRLCNVWMGDHHCATDHLKSAEHNGNYMNFLDGHPDWEAKWGSDREKARARAGLEVIKPEPARKSRFGDHPLGQPIADDNGDENGRSIRVHMRNTIKVDENRSDGDFVAVKKTVTSTKDVGLLDEWMGKPQKIALDIIDTQKFAEIVRQKHGKEQKPIVKEEATRVQQEPSRPPPPHIQLKDREHRDSRREESGGRGRYDRVELQISSRENREKDRFRDSRGGRRRSRSRSRSRDRGYHGRRRSRSRSRSRSRDRDRRDRDRGGRDRVETVKKLPMIGKMPLYKRPLTTGGKDKEKSEDGKGSPALSSEDSKKLSGFKHTSHHDESNTSVTSENLSGVSHEHSSKVGLEGISSSEVRHFAMETAGDHRMFVSTEGRPTVPDNDLKPPGEKEAPGGTNLPDDLQQALDIIYKGGGKPITIPPPPLTSSIPTGVPPPSAAPYDYASANTGYPGNYMGYEPYQMSFDGYGPAAGFDDNMEEVSVPGNVPVLGDSASATPVADSKSVNSKVEPETAEDDMEDLRMLGIDVDDVAVVIRR